MLALIQTFLHFFLNRINQFLSILSASATEPRAARKCLRRAVRCIRNQVVRTIPDYPRLAEACS
jgi:hypothetical protein